MKSTYLLLFLCILLAFVNGTVVHGQAVTCQIGFLAFRYPHVVNSTRQVDITTGVDVFYCSQTSQEYRVELYNAQQKLLSSNSTIGSPTALNGIVANVTNAIATPPASGDYPFYAMAYAISTEGNNQGSVVATYETSFNFNVTLT